jgi:hypothetical protein
MNFAIHFPTVTNNNMTTVRSLVLSSVIKETVEVGLQHVVRRSLIYYTFVYGVFFVNQHGDEAKFYVFMTHLIQAECLLNL